MTKNIGAPRTLYDKLWSSHVVRDYDDGTSLIYVDRHLLHEVTTPQSFVALDQGKRTIHRPASNLAVPDHAVPTEHRDQPIADPLARAQTERLTSNTSRYGLELIDLHDPRQGIVHIVGPEQGFTLPGIFLACGDSHTATHGAFGTLAVGIGASECAIVMATQCIRQVRSKTMRIDITGTPSEFICAKDIALAIIARIGANGASGHAVEYAGPVVEAMDMAARMTLCNMSIECGARAGFIAPDETTFAYLEGRPMAPKGENWKAAVAYWRTLASDPGAVYDRVETIDVSDLAPTITWGTSPEEALPVTARAPDPALEHNPARGARQQRALNYMGLTPDTALIGIRIDRAFIGSCTNGRIEDLRAAAAIARGRTVAAHVRAMVVPGSGLVKRQAEAEGLADIFRSAGFEWRDAGCSMCVAMNSDRLAPGERCASTSNRNFEGRQGPGGRTHLMSPAMVAAAAVSGCIVDVRTMGSA
ncbi:3-isopropylmalate dehydratase large subunit [Roseiarcaceae bacterium H3SJ34-1]|uniref:3-isopropylmalate dehydratase large subunit n=1 Tax=Terripilifer ovatus TaxID=3032367 RepID=UPI003AB95DE2|nr:3-isopropylmalate dehydratase large subunit [Roseiarcaceae bacterium H3SJ34-1]